MRQKLHRRSVPAQGKTAQGSVSVRNRGHWRKVAGCIGSEDQIRMLPRSQIPTTSGVPLRRMLSFLGANVQYCTDSTADSALPFLFHSRGFQMAAHNGALIQTTTSPLSSRFIHRPLDNGSVESICTNCFLTISRTWGNFRVKAEELNVIESAHQCDQRHKPIKPQDSN